MPTVLVIGGSGYLGRFLVKAFSAQQEWTVSYTYCSNDPLDFGDDQIAAFRVNLLTGEGIHGCVNAIDVPDVVVNCAAISSPAACEQDSSRAKGINIPNKFLEALMHALDTSEGEKEPLLIHLSTDQVYSGTKSYSNEEDACAPQNQYGHSKLEAEKYIASCGWKKYVILRSSIIYGPKVPPGGPVSRSLFVQFVDEALAKQEKTSFFFDEWRNPIYVGDIIEVVMHFAGKAHPCSLNKIYCMGGPERLSRTDMARAIASVRGHSEDYINSVSTSSIQRGVNSPPDISMDSAKLEQELGHKFTSFHDGIRLTFS